MTDQKTALTQAILTIRELKARLAEAEERKAEEPIAVIGMGCRFPEASDPDAFWRVLQEGVDTTRDIPPDRWDVEAYYDPDPDAAGKMYVRRGAFLEAVDRFDAPFFGISPREAHSMDPRQRFLLEVTWEALENAGIVPDTLRESRTGVYMGLDEIINEYVQLGMERMDFDPYMATGNGLSFAVGRVSHKLGLQGPCMGIATTCSSSLVAVHTACGNLRTGECDLAIAGGVRLHLTPEDTLQTCRMKALSPDGRCKTFDASADGYGRGEGCGIVVLKRLSDAKRDNDPILALIRGSAVNHDGPSAGLTVPNGAAQEKLLCSALESAGVRAPEIAYVEAHGTGTSLGDPVEIHALARAMGEGRKRPLLVGSVKTNIGHLEEAAGVAGLIKTILSLRHGAIPPHLHFTHPNPHISWNDLPVAVPTALTPWPEGKKRIAGVSAFGMSGTNVHMILEGFDPAVSADPEAGSHHLIVLSAKNEERLRAYAQRLSDFLHSSPTVGHPRFSLANMAYTLQVGRKAMEDRAALIVSDIDELAEKLTKFSNGDTAIENLWQGKTRIGQNIIRNLFEGETGETFIRTVFDQKEFSKIAQLWVSGMEIDWNLLYPDRRPARIQLPTYPFARERYWLPKSEGPLPHTPSRSADSHPEDPPVICFGKQKETNPLPRPQDSDQSLSSAMTDYLVSAIASVLGADPERMDPDEGFEAYGLDSIMINILNTELAQQFGELPATLFFTYKNIRSLAEYFVENHPEKARSLFAALPLSSKSPGHLCPLRPFGPFVHSLQKKPDTLPEDRETIAIIGLSGRYPMADTLEEFWENLKTGKDAITEIPKKRWDYRKYPDIYCRWGGFLADIDKFDPGFFNISPNSARRTDPQERLFLQAAWHCIEDAGYTRRRLEDPDAGDRRGNVGVFAGVSFNEYQLWGLAEWEKGNIIPVESQICSVANRVSYFLNLGGPSLSVDTACSSSLYAVHLACASILNGECGMALAGGVNLSVHPSKYIGLCGERYAASDGRCRAFGQGGDGYVPGEGAGAVLLKPLSKALEDRDHIYAVIRGTAVNHDGKTHGYSVPNPVAQSEVIRSALEKSGVDPRTITYVEAHGTGTALGDPIEIDGLTKAYRPYTDETQYCAIGSVKSNIGHLEAAAGISQLTKVILQMKYKTLVPSLLHSEGLNPDIDFKKSPFFVQQTTAKWQRPVIRRNGTETEYPRRAALSSFGFSGVNLHAVLEEYQENRTTCDDSDNKPGMADTAAVIPLSAKTGECLMGYVKKIKDFLDNPSDPNTVPAIRDIAYTFQIGREAMPFRVALVVNSAHELIEKLDEAVRKFPDQTGRPVAPGIFTGSLKPSRKKGAHGLNGRDRHEYLKDMIAQKKVNQIAESWAHGAEIDWEALYSEGDRPRRISLPVYPFLRERYWITDRSAPSASPPSSPEPVKIPLKKRTGGNEVTLSPFLEELAEAPEDEQAEMIKEHLRAGVGKLLGFAPSDLPGQDQGFFEMGMESVQVVQFQAEIENTFGVKLSDTATFDYPNIRELADYILELIPFDELEIAEPPISANDNARIHEEMSSPENLYDALHRKLQNFGEISPEISEMNINQVETMLENRIESIDLESNL